MLLEHRLQRITTHRDISGWAQNIAFRLNLTLILSVAVVGCRDTRLQQAIRNGDSIETAKLLDENVDVNTRGSGGKTPIHAAIEANDRETFSLVHPIRLTCRGTDRATLKTIPRLYRHS